MLQQPLRSQGKWLADDLIGNVTVSWENTYTLAFVCTKELERQMELERRIAKDYNSLDTLKN